MYSFSVAGSTAFPLYMLAGGKCYPMTATDALAMSDLRFGEQRTVTLGSQHRPNEAKWRMAGWPIMYCTET